MNRRDFFKRLLGIAGAMLIPPAKAAGIVPYTFGMSSIYGYTNFPQQKTTVAEVLKMKSIIDKHCGPYIIRVKEVVETMEIGSNGTNSQYQR